jgi:hypothetical protein
MKISARLNLCGIQKHGYTIDKQWNNWKASIERGFHLKANKVRFIVIPSEPCF